MLGGGGDDVTLVGLLQSGQRSRQLGLLASLERRDRCAQLEWGTGSAALCGKRQRRRGEGSFT